MSACEGGEDRLQASLLRPRGVLCSASPLLPLPLLSFSLKTRRRIRGDLPYKARCERCTESQFDGKMQAMSGGRGLKRSRRVHEDARHSTRVQILRVRVCARARVCGGVGVGAALLAGLAHGRDGPVEVEPGGDAAHCHTIPLCGWVRVCVHVCVCV